MLIHGIENPHAIENPNVVITGLPLYTTAPGVHNLCASVGIPAEAALVTHKRRSAVPMKYANAIARVAPEAVETLIRKLHKSVFRGVRIGCDRYYRTHEEVVEARRKSGERQRAKIENRKAKFNKASYRSPAHPTWNAHRDTSETTEATT
jgi:hypothetical protein